MVVDHSSCGNYQCKSHDIDEASYVTQHTAECRCAHVKVDTDRIFALLTEDKIPCIAVVINDEGGEKSITLDVSDGSDGSYTAISHVWADGLGNLHENSLPQCQTLRLHRLVSEASNISTRFWLDTLCIPLEKRGRSLALQMLDKTYTTAQRTLVLNVELMNTPALVTRSEILARIVTCSWMRRLWTLEEGILSDSFVNTRKVFQLRERCVTMSELADKQETKADSGLRAHYERRVRYERIARDETWKIRGQVYVVQRVGRSHWCID